MTFDYNKSKATADTLIRKYGMKASLRRSGVDRDCYVVISSYDPQDRSNMLANPTDRRVIMSAAGLESEPPDNEKDMLVTYVQPLGTVVDELLPFTAPVKKTSPAGIVVCYEFTVRR